MHSVQVFKRITDLLINLLVQDLLRRDGIYKTISKLDRSKQTNVAKYEQFLNILVSSGMCQKKLKWRHLTGPKKQRISHHTMHAFAMHIPEFIHMYGNLAPRIRKAK